MDNKALVLKSVNTAKTKLGTLLVDFTFKKKIGSTYVSGKNTINFLQDQIISGIYDKFESNEIDGSQVKITDTKLLLFVDVNSNIPVAGDLIVEGDNNFQVVKSYPTYAGNQVAMCSVQVRT